MSRKSIRRRVLVLALTLTAATVAGPALAGPALTTPLTWQQAWNAARAVLTRWVRADQEPAARAKRGTTIGPDGIVEEPPTACKPANENQPSTPPGCGG